MKLTYLSCSINLLNETEVRNMGVGDRQPVQSRLTTILNFFFVVVVISIKRTLQSRFKDGVL